MKRHFIYLLGIAAMMVACAPKADTERLICAEADMQEFPYQKNGLHVVKLQTVTPVEGVDGLEVIQTSFINLGKPVTVKAYELCRTEIEPKGDVVWSLQPTSSNARLDWVLPVKAGFQKENYLGMNNSDYGGGVPLKPDPAGALLIAGQLDVSPADCLYVGDTSTDMNCGNAAGMETVGVLWGYRPREELTANGARHLISDPMELIDLAEA